MGVQVANCVSFHFVAQVNPGARVVDWMFGVIAAVIIANIVLIATLGVRLFFKNPLSKQPSLLAKSCACNHHFVSCHAHRSGSTEIEPASRQCLRSYTVCPESEAYTWVFACCLADDMRGGRQL